MTSYVGPQDPTVTPTFGVVGDEFIQQTASGDRYFVKEAPPGTNTAWELFGETLASTSSGIPPDTYYVDGDGSPGSYPTLQEAIDQAVTDGASQFSQKTVIVFPGIYSDPVAIPTGIILRAQGAATVVTGAVTVNGLCTIIGSFTILTIAINNTARISGTEDGPLSINACVINGDSTTAPSPTFEKCVFPVNAPTFNHTNTNPCSLTFKDCRFNFLGAGPFVTTDPLVADSIRFENCIQAGLLTIDGRFKIELINHQQSGGPLAVPGSGILIQNNNLILDAIFANPTIYLEGCQIAHLEIQNGGGFPAYANNCRIANTIAPWNGECIKLGNNGSLISANSIIGDPVIASLSPAITADNAQIILLKSRVLTNDSAMNLVNGAVGESYSSELVCTGASRAIEGDATGVLFIAATLFLNDDRINPVITLLPTGRMALIAAGTDALPPLPPGYQIA